MNSTRISIHIKTSTVMIRFSARGANLLLAPQGGRLSETGRLYFEKQPNVQNKTLINIKITNNNTHTVSNSNKLFKIQLLLK